MSKEKAPQVILDCINMSTADFKKYADSMLRYREEMKDDYVWSQVELITLTTIDYIQEWVHERFKARAKNFYDCGE